MSPLTKEIEETLFLDFVLHGGSKQKLSPGTLKSRLAAIRGRHLAEGYEDTLGHLRRDHMAVEGFKRRYRQPSRRRPVTTEMLRWIKGRLDPGARRDDAVIFAAVSLGFFFLLRVSEYQRGAGRFMTLRRACADGASRGGHKDVRQHAATERAKSGSTSAGP